MSAAALAISIDDLPRMPSLANVFEHSPGRFASAIDKARETAQAHVADYTRMVDEWAIKMDRHREIEAHVETLSEEDQSSLERTIETLEHFAETRVKDSRKAVKTVRKTSRAVGFLAPALGRIFEDVGQSMLFQEKRLIDGVLDHVLWMRAVLASHDPVTERGPRFSDPEALKQYLRSARA